MCSITTKIKCKTLNNVMLERVKRVTSCEHFKTVTKNNSTEITHIKEVTQK